MLSNASSYETRRHLLTRILELLPSGRTVMVVCLSRQLIHGSGRKTLVVPQTETQSLILSGRIGGRKERVPVSFW